MREKSGFSLLLYDELIRRGYPAEFCDEITKNLNTDWTAKRMLGYLRQFSNLPMVEVVDEMLAILEDRNRIMQKKELEAVNSGWNDFLRGDYLDND